MAKMVERTAGFIRTGTHRIIIMRPEHELHLEAVYIYADCVSFQICSLLQTDGGPYIITTYRVPVRDGLLKSL